MRCHSAVAILLLTLCSASSDEPVLVSIGGPRKVEARIAKTNMEYRVAVRMLPVQAFDPATNDRLNREKARLFGLQALTQFLSGKESAEAIVSGVRVIGTGEDKPYFTLTFAVPRDKVSLVEPTRPETRSPAGKPETGAEKVAFTSTLFTRKHDLGRTLAQLAGMFESELVELERVKLDFDRGIADIEERAVKSFNTLRTEIKEDKLLLGIESEELLAKTSEEMRRLLNRLTVAVARREAGGDEPKPIVPAAVETKFRDIEVEKPFGQYLFASPLLMEATGAKLIRLPNGDQVILSVASTALKDATANERLRAERVCKVKALASVVAEKEGVKVFRLERLEEKTVVKTEGEKETGKSVSELLQVTNVKVEGITRGMPVVGKWRSKDGEVFYMALGVILDKSGEPIREKP